MSHNINYIIRHFCPGPGYLRSAIKYYFIVQFSSSAEFSLSRLVPINRSVEAMHVRKVANDVTSVPPEQYYYTNTRLPARLASRDHYYHYHYHCQFPPPRRATMC